MCVCVPRVKRLACEAVAAQVKLCVLRSICSQAMPKRAGHGVVDHIRLEKVDCVILGGQKKPRADSNYHRTRGDLRAGQLHR